MYSFLYIVMEIEASLYKIYENTKCLLRRTVYLTIYIVYVKFYKSEYQNIANQITIRLKLTLPIAILQ